MFRIKFDFVDARTLLTIVSNRLANPRDLMESIAGEAAKAVQENFRALNSARSKYGHNFYNREGADRTEFLTSGNKAVVAVRSYKMAHKLKGGEVRAKNVKYLTIPVSEMAKQRALSPSLWKEPNLFLLKSSRGNLLLASSQGKGALTIHYLLRRSVTHKPTPEVIPERNALLAAVRRGIDNAKFLKEIKTIGRIK